MKGRNVKQWESETQEAYSYEMTLKDYEAAALARDSMEAIYQKGQYPSDLASSYANWYTLGSISGESTGYHISHLQCLLLEACFYKI